MPKPGRFFLGWLGYPVQSYLNWLQNVKFGTINLFRDILSYIFMQLGCFQNWLSKICFIKAGFCCCTSQLSPVWHLRFLRSSIEHSKWFYIPVLFNIMLILHIICRFQKKLCWLKWTWNFMTAVLEKILTTLSIIFFLFFRPIWVQSLVYSSGNKIEPRQKAQCLSKCLLMEIIVSIVITWLISLLSTSHEFFCFLCPVLEEVGFIYHRMSFPRQDFQMMTYLLERWQTNGETSWRIK